MCHSQPRTLCLALNHILKFISHKASFKDVYREAGILTLLINSLKSYTTDMKQQNSPERGVVSLSLSLSCPLHVMCFVCSSAHKGSSVSIVGSGPLNSPSLPISQLEGQLEECVFLLMECLRATIEGQRERERERERERKRERERERERERGGAIGRYSCCYLVCW